MAEVEATWGFNHEEVMSSSDEAMHSIPTSDRTKRKKTKYPKASCELCKFRKVKCDRAEPACSWCARHNRTCVYVERHLGSCTGSTVELEAKVNRVDAMLQTLWRRVEDHVAYDHLNPVPQAPSQLANHPNTSQNNNYPTLPNENRSQERRISVGFSTPSWQRPESHDRAQDDAKSSIPGPSIPGPPTSLPIEGNGGDPSPFNASDQGRRAPCLRASSSPLSSATDLPPHDMIYTLVDLYFKHCNTWCPILERKTTFGVFFGSTSMSELDRILLHAIVATTLRFLKDPRLSPEMRAHYHAVSKNTVIIYTMEHVSVGALKALVILALDELGTSNGPRGWNLLSLLTQNVRHLDLCEENSMYLFTGDEDIPHTGSVRRVAVSRPESWIEDEGRRRLCWMVYLLDRYATVATTTFDFMLDGKAMKRVLPCSYDLFSRNVPVETRSLSSTLDQQGGVSYLVDKPESLGSFSYHCEILRILSRVHDFLKTPVDITSSTEMAGWRSTYRLLDSALDNWLQSLPSEYSRISALCHSDPVSRVANWFMLHSAYVTAVVRLHSSAAYPTCRSHIFVPSHYAMQRCLSAVQSLRDTTQDVYEANGLDLVGPPFAFSLWVAARLLIVHAATVGCPVDSKIDFFIDILGYVGRNWEVANNYARILARVVQRGRQSEMVFTAMRKSAYDLVQLTSSTRQSGLEETSSQSVSLSRLDDIDVFDFFNYPKTLELGSRVSGGQMSILHPQGLAGVEADATRKSNAVPDPESDWLGYTSPFN